MNSLALIFVGLSLVLVLVILGLKWRGRLESGSERIDVEPSPQYNELEMKDSLDEHLDVLTKKLADKEGRLLLSKNKIRESLNEIENLHAIDEDVKNRYRDIMETLRSELQNNEKDCKKLQEQIEWVSHRRAELEDEVHHEAMIYEEAKLSNNLVEISRGRKSDQGEYYHPKLMDKPKLEFQSLNTVRRRKESYLPSPVPALVGTPRTDDIRESCTRITEQPSRNIKGEEVRPGRILSPKNDEQSQTPNPIPKFCELPEGTIFTLSSRTSW